MKFFRKKNARPAETRPQTAGPDPERFYSQHAGEAPLDEYSTGTVGSRVRRTSRHSPALRRETSNRASNRAIAIILLRAVLVVVLLVAGFIVLKLVVAHIADNPSEKERQKWEVKAALMEKSAPPSGAFAGTPVPQELVVSAALIGQRLEQWEQTERHLRSAEALNRRGIDEEAIQRLSQALRTMPDNRAAQNLLMNIYMHAGRYAEAVPLCIRLLDQDCGQQDLQMNLVQALQASGQIEAGLVLADRLLLNQPNNLTVLSIAAAGQIKLGNKEAALALFGRILENDAKNKGALEGCAKIHLEQGDYEKAVPYYLELVRLDPKPNYYQVLARCYAQQDQPGKAVIFMGQAASLFGTAEIAPWLRDPSFDIIRETVDFRSFADRIVGIETRKAIEDMNRREAEKAKTIEPGGMDFPKQPELQPRRPGK